MEWLTAVKKTLNYIEDHLKDELDIPIVAQSVYISPYYLQKGFQIITGYTLGEYIRNRRLSEAGQELMSGKEKIIDVALDYRWETPESFTKAFTRFHGVNPSQVRNNPDSLKRFLPLRINIDITGGNKMDYVLSPMWSFRVIGFERTFSYENSYKEIPEFWDEICEKYCNHTIYAGLEPSCPEEKAIIDNCIGEYGICIDDMGGGKFRYLIAGRYTGGNVPEGMTVYELPAGEWAKFRITGPMPDALQNINTKIFKEWLPGNPDFEMAGNCCVEWYSCDGYKTDDNYQSAIWIPVRRLSVEAEAKWGDTLEFAQATAKASERTQNENRTAADGLMDIISAFGEIKESDPTDNKAKMLTAELCNYISDNFYDCRKEVFASLGEMYVSDERFRKNIDRKGGEGTAEFVSRCIKEFCK